MTLPQQPTMKEDKKSHNCHYCNAYCITYIATGWVNTFICEDCCRDLLNLLKRTVSD